MERYLLQFMLVMVAFSGGGLLINVWLNELWNKNIEIAPPPNFEIEAAKLTFDCNRHGMGEAVNRDGIFASLCTGTDGSKIFVGDYEDTWTSAAAERILDLEIKGASKVVSVTPIVDRQGAEIGKRALLKNQGAVKIVELLKVDEKRHFRPFVVSFINAPDFKHALPYENQEKAQSRSVRAASF